MKFIKCDFEGFFSTFSELQKFSKSLNDAESWRIATPKTREKELRAPSFYSVCLPFLGKSTQSKLCQKNRMEWKSRLGTAKTLVFLFELWRNRWKKSQKSRETWTIFFRFGSRFRHTTLFVFFSNSNCLRPCEQEFSYFFSTVFFVFFVGMISRLSCKL